MTRPEKTHFLSYNPHLVGLFTTGAYLASANERPIVPGVAEKVMKVEPR